MTWHHDTITLRPYPRGFHLITAEVCAGIRELPTISIGMAHLLLQHTSASLCLNENADPTVRLDLAHWADRAAPDGASWMRHDDEGPDDMPAHIKSALFGTSLHLPIRDGRLALGTWQGIWLGEHRDNGGARTVLATVQGQRRES